MVEKSSNKTTNLEFEPKKNISDITVTDKITFEEKAFKTDTKTNLGRNNKKITSTNGLFFWVSLVLLLMFGVGLFGLYSVVVLPQIVRLSLSSNIDIYNNAANNLKKSTDGIVVLSDLKNKDLESTNNSLNELSKKINDLDELQKTIKSDQNRLDSGIVSDTREFKDETFKALDKQLSYIFVLKTHTFYQTCLLSKYTEVKFKLEPNSQKISSLGVGASNDEISSSYKALEQASLESKEALGKIEDCYKQASYEMTNSRKESLTNDIKLMENLAKNARLVVEGTAEGDFSKFKSGSAVVGKVSDQDFSYLKFENFNQALQTNSNQVQSSLAEMNKTQDDLQNKLKSIKEKYRF